MRKQKAAPAADTKQEVLVNVVLDRSGSMQANRAETISGYNHYVDGLKADGKMKYTITLIQFDSPSEGPELTVSYSDKPVGDVPALTDKTYEPRGWTPLYDAVGECIRRVEAKDRAVLTVIITDGQENASRDFTQATIKDLIKQKESEGWKFVFLGANIDSFAVGGAMNVPASAIANYDPRNQRAMYSSLRASTSAYAGTVKTAGMRAAAGRSFFTDTQRQHMTGGRPAAPPPFPSTAPLRAASRPAGRKWTVRDQVPQP
jgi:hypothetical protein